MVTRRQQPTITTDSHYIALDERVHGLAVQVSGLQEDVHDLRGTMASSAEVASLSNKIDGLMSQLAERGRPQWQVIFTAAGVLLAVVTAIGSLAYIPVVGNQSRLEGVIAREVIPRTEVERRWDWADERYKRMDDQVKRLENQLSGSFTMKDAIDTMRERLDRMQSQINSLTPKVYQAP